MITALKMTHKTFNGNLSKMENFTLHSNVSNGSENKLIPFSNAIP